MQKIEAAVREDETLTPATRAFADGYERPLRDDLILWT